MIVNVKMGYNNPKIQTLLENVLFVFQFRLPQLLSQAYDATSTRCCKEVGLRASCFLGGCFILYSLIERQALELCFEVVVMVTAYMQIS